MAQVLKPKVESMKVDLEELHSLPVMTRLPSPKLVAVISAKAAEDPASIPPLQLGRVNGLLYAIEGPETAKGLLKAGIVNAEAVIREFQTVEELVQEHVHVNFYPHAIDPLKVREVIDYVAERCGGWWPACCWLWLDKMPDIIEAAEKELEEEARSVMLDMTTRISEKVYSVVTPAYYVKLISRIKEDEQAEAARELAGVTLGSAKSGKKFTWLTYDGAVAAVKPFHQRKEVPPVESRVATEVDVADLKSKRPKKPAGKRAVEKAAKYIAEDPDLIFVPETENNRDMIVNKRTGRVALAEEKNGAYTMTDDLGRPAQVLPADVMEHLGVEDGRPIQVYKFASFAKAKAAMTKAKADGRCVVLSTERIPRR